MTAYEREVQNYRKAIDALIGLGLKRTRGRIGGSQDAILARLKKQMMKFQIDADTKAILSTRENWALASRIALEVEEILDKDFTGQTGNLLAEMKQRAYKSGVAFGEAGAAYNGAAQIFQGVDATTLRLVRKAALDQIVGIAEDQKQYIRDVLTKGTLENKPWTAVMDQVIHDGKVPALVSIDKNGVKRYIDMETRVQNTIRTETARIAEVGSRDKAREIFGADLWGEWVAIMDGRTRDRHRDRHGSKRSAGDWENVGHSSDGRVLMPGEEIECRCYMRWGSKEDILGQAAPTPTPPEIVDTPPAPPTPVKAAEVVAEKAVIKQTGKLKARPIKDHDDFKSFITEETGIVEGVVRPPGGSAGPKFGKPAKDIEGLVDIPGINPESLTEIARGFVDAHNKLPMRIRFLDTYPTADAHAIAHYTGGIGIEKNWANNFIKITAAEHKEGAYSVKKYIETIKARIIQDEAKIKAAEAAGDTWATKLYKKNLRQDKNQLIKYENWHRWTNGYKTPAEKLYCTSIHEYGHQVHNRIQAGMPKEAYAWKAKVHGTRIAERWKISEYAAKNANECFAECFTSWIRGETIDSDLFRYFVDLMGKVEANWPEIAERTFGTWGVL